MAKHKLSYTHRGKGWSELCQSWQDEHELCQPWLDISSPMHNMEMGDLSFASRGKTWLICASHGYRHKLSYEHCGKGDLCQSRHDVTELHHFWLDVSYAVHTLQTSSVLCIYKKDLGKPHSQISIFAKRIIIFCPELWYSEDRYGTLLDAAIQLSSQETIYFQRELWEYSSNLMDDIYIFGL